ncbi:hypothetical protein FB45DRAFT_279039 [Roridomyces roridus]|uniref:DUF6699 domain-containing protein n=1 Tax=Roridomyces roridus TaxID=1738132 RepID=A0AAD7FU96_9AGAR|nr:hypothetical protein FB45DRAFT_279039 [Roridomyces roridus]
MPAPRSYSRFGSQSLGRTSYYAQWQWPPLMLAGRTPTNQVADPLPPPAPAPRLPVVCYHPPIQPPILVSPLLVRHRSTLHPYLNWNISTSPLRATQRYGPLESPPLSIQPNIHLLSQTATLPPLKSLHIIITSSSSSSSSLGKLDALHVERTDRDYLTVGDVLNAIHQHISRPLVWHDIIDMSADKWERASRSLQDRAQDAAARPRGDDEDEDDPRRELVLQRLDLLDGHLLFDGIQPCPQVGRTYFRLSLT